MTPEQFVIDVAGSILTVLMYGAISLLAFSLLKEITR